MAVEVVCLQSTVTLVDPQTSKVTLQVQMISTITKSKATHSVITRSVLLESDINNG